MPLSAQEKAAIITVAGNWALKTLEETSSPELIALNKAGDKYDSVTIIDKALVPCFITHYNNLIKAFSDKKQ